MNVGKTKIMRISRSPTPAHITINKKQPENMKHFIWKGSVIKYDARYTGEIKCGIVMAKAAFKMNQALFTNKLELHVRKKPVKCYMWSVALCGAETGTVLHVERSFV